MVRRIEWRSRGEMDDTILVLDHDQTSVQRVVEPTPPILRDFLNDMEELDNWRDVPAAAKFRPSPADWGQLVMARATTGEILDMDPERYWDGIYLWFRSRGADPHAPRPRIAP